MKPDEVIVRFRQPTGNDPVGNLWQNSGEVHRFASFKAARSFIRDCDAIHPLTGDRLGGADLEKTVRSSQLEDSGIYFLDVFGKVERTERNKFYEQLRSGTWQQQ